MSSLLVYGAAGYTGKLILAAARKRVPTVGAARRVDALDGDVRQLDLVDDTVLRRELRNHTAVLNCAGPFRHTWGPLVQACLETGTHYLDICAEWPVFEALRAVDDAAKRAGIMLLPGVGFDVVASDCLAAHVAARLPGAQRLQIGVSGLELFSRGSASTVVEMAGDPVRIRRDGLIVPASRVLEARFDYGSGPKPSIAVSWADVSTAHHTTGIPNIEVYFESTPLVAGLALANRAFGWSMKTPWLRRLAQIPIEALPPGPAPHVRSARHAVVVAHAEDQAGGVARARLTTPEAYTLSVSAAVAAAERVLAKGVRPGFQTPGGLFGADFVLELEGVSRCDLD